jgi:hypothetical protein
MAYEEKFGGANNKSYITVIPELPVNHATQINITRLETGDSFILESVCAIPMIFRNEEEDAASLENSGQPHSELKIQAHKIMPFSRILVNKQTLIDMFKSLKQMGISLEG